VIPTLNSTELFDAPKGPRPAQPLLVAAIKAREQAGGAEHAAKAEAGNGNNSSGRTSSGSSESSKPQVRRPATEQKVSYKPPSSEPMEHKLILKVKAFSLTSQMRILGGFT
jgi:hypothetical protein